MSIKQRLTKPFSLSDDRCPMNFDDGANPWKEPGSNVHIFKFQNTGTASVTTTLSGILFFLLLPFHLARLG